MQKKIKRQQIKQRPKRHNFIPNNGAMVAISQVFAGDVHTPQSQNGKKQKQTPKTNGRQKRQKIKTGPAKKRAKSAGCFFCQAGTCAQRHKMRRMLK